MKYLSLVITLVATPVAAAPLSPVQCLRKMALDLTTRGPTPEEVAAVKSGTPLAEMAEGYLASTAFADVTFHWFRQRFAPGRDSTGKADYEEPARIARRIVLEDRDLRELLTADWTVAKDGTVVPVTGKPAAGVLSTQHVMSAELGILRRRWAARLLKDWAGIALVPATVPPDGDPDVSRAALARNTACSGCHAHPVFGLDGIAAFSDCWKDDGTYKAGCREPQAGLLGQKGAGLPALGRITTETTELAAQLVNIFAERLLGRELAKPETALYLEAVRALRKSGFRARPLLKTLVTSGPYCAR